MWFIGDSAMPISERQAGYGGDGEAIRSARRIQNFITTGASIPLSSCEEAD